VVNQVLNSIQREVVQVRVAHSQDQAQARESLYVRNETLQACFPQGNPMSFVQGINCKHRSAARGLSCSIQSSEKLVGADLRQVQLRQNLPPRVGLGQGSGQDQDEGVCQFELLYSEVSQQMRLADASLSRDNQLPLVRQSPTRACELAANVVYR
jgi:hypothetical protein